MRIAVLADIHGNDDALGAVLKALSRETKLDRILVLGDLVAFGPDPGAVVERLRSSATVSCLLGNCDRWVAFDDVPLPPEHHRTEENLRGCLRLLMARLPNQYLVRSD